MLRALEIHEVDNFPRNVVERHRNERGTRLRGRGPRTRRGRQEKREDGPTIPLNDNLFRSVDELEFSVRSQNCLQNADIKYIGELVQKTEQEMLKTKNFGHKSLNEIKEILREMGLELGMKIDHFPSREEIESRRRASEKETA